MKESVLRAAAIASLALALIMSVTTWIGLSSSSHRGSFFLGFFEFALILFLGIVAWALFNSLADIVTVRTSLEVLNVRMTRIEEALGVVPPQAAISASGGDTGSDTGGDTGNNTGSGSGGDRGAAPESEPPDRTPSDREE